MPIPPKKALEDHLWRIGSTMDPSEVQRSCEKWYLKQFDPRRLQEYLTMDMALIPALKGDDLMGKIVIMFRQICGDSKARAGDRMKAGEKLMEFMMRGGGSCEFSQQTVGNNPARARDRSTDWRQRMTGHRAIYTQDTEKTNGATEEDETTSG